ncbi:MAG TPA: hypothetical protein VKB76_00565, partial [Ktedonobacterales bacterium]|nr:hypothetical protein [Ktedonobacterales bacterium]
RTSAAFEPALDYVVVKIPRWPFDKFPGADRLLGTQMKATGEVMAIDRTFEAALQKAMRSLEIKSEPPQPVEAAIYRAARIAEADDPFSASGSRRAANVVLQSEFSSPATAHDPAVIEATDARIWRLLETLRADHTNDAIDTLHKETGIDCWFLLKLRRIVALEERLREQRADLTPDLVRQAKRMGFADAQIAQVTGRTPAAIRQLRADWDIHPVYKMVDTCAGEFAAQTPYYYSTYEQENEAPPLAQPKAVVIGSGPIRIGQGIEFDYCSVRSATALRDAHVASIMINSNPETVSTDFDMSDRLYFEPLDIESVMSVLENEVPPPNPLPILTNGEGEPRSPLSIRQDGEGPGVGPLPPVIVQFGGQTAINLAEELEEQHVPILGSAPEMIDLAEDRERFDTLMEELAIPRPRGAA